MRLNPRAFEKALKTDGSLTNFWKYDLASPIKYDADTQIPIDTGTVVSEFADILDFTIAEIKSAGGLLDENSKKFIVMPGTDLVKGDEILDSSLLETYKIVGTFTFANRKNLFATKTIENPTQHE